MKNNHEYRFKESLFSFCLVLLITLIPSNQNIAQRQFLEEPCNSDKRLEIEWYGIKDRSSPLPIQIANTYPNTKKVVLEAVCRKDPNGDCPAFIKYSVTENGNTQVYTIPREAVAVSSSSVSNPNAYVYRFDYNGTPDFIRYVPYPTYSNMRGLTAWIIEEDPINPNIPNGQQVDTWFFESGWHCTNISIPASQGNNKNATVYVPIHEHNYEPNASPQREVHYKLKAGGQQTGLITKNGPNNGMGSSTEEVRLDQLTLTNIPANATTLELCVRSPDYPLGSSFVVGSIAVTLDKCQSCDLVSTIQSTSPTCSENTDDFTSIGSAQPVPVANGTTTVIVVGGIAPYTYLWSDGQTSQTATGLSPSTYSVTVTDALGCTLTDSAVVDEISPLFINVLNTVNVTCYGDLDGSVEIEFGGGNEQLYNIYLDSVYINGGLNSGNYTIENLSAGTHIVSICDANLCFLNIPITITEPTVLVAQIQTTPPTCPENAVGYYDLNTPAPVSDGEAQVIVSGGTPPYMYLWSNGDTQATAGGLSSGPVSLTVTDANGCPFVASSVVDTIPPLEALIATTDVSCNGGSDGSITIEFGGGNGAGYILILNEDMVPGVFNAGTYTFENLSAGTYVIIVCDVNGCILSTTVVITEPEEELTATIEATPPTCSQNAESYIDIPNPQTAPTADGTATVTAIGGTPPYTYLWSDSQTTAMATNLASGIYMVTVTDDNECELISEVLVDTIPPLFINVLSTENVICNGDSTGSITIEFGGGNGPLFTIFLNNTFFGSSTSDPSTYTFNNLPAGMYQIAICDGNLCVLYATATIIESAALLAQIQTTPPTCPENAVGYYDLNTPAPVSDGEAQVIVSGGTPPYMYLWSNGDTQATTGGLSSGPISVTVTDANGCPFVASSVVDTIPPLEALIATTDVSCNGGSDGSITLEFGGGNGAGYVLILNEDMVPGVLNAGTYTFENLSAGTYVIIVCDVNGCILALTACVKEPEMLTATVETTDDSCNGSEGSVDLTPSGGTAPYTFAWSNGATTEDLVNVPAGTYEVLVTDSSECTVSVTAVVGEATGCLTVDVTLYQPPCSGDNGSIDIIITDGQQPYTFVWSNGDTTEDLVNVPADTYTVTVTDAQGNMVVESYELVEPDLLNIDFGMNYMGGLQYEITGIVTGGTPPYSYNWIPLGDTSTSVLVAVNECFSLKIADSNGCTLVASDCANIPSLDNVLDPVSIDIYPNPTRGRVYVESNILFDSNTQIELLTLEGKVVKRFSNSSKEQRIELNVADQVSGVYLLIIRNGKQTITRKIIIKTSIQSRA